MTSDTALLLPIQDVARTATAVGALSLIDGAHGPGQVPVDVEALGCDFYVGTLNKWLGAPLGAAFLYARREHHSWLRSPLIGFGDVAPEASLHHRLQGIGTMDHAAWCSIPDAMRFHGEVLAPARLACIRRLNRMTEGLEEIGWRPLGTAPLQMRSFQPPAGHDVWELVDHLGRQGIEVHKAHLRTGERFLRISVGWYIDDEDVARFQAALQDAA